MLALIQNALAKLAVRLRKLTAAGSVPCDEAEAIHDTYLSASGSEEQLVIQRWLAGLVG